MSRPMSYEQFAQQFRRAKEMPQAEATRLYEIRLSQEVGQIVLCRFWPQNGEISPEDIWPHVDGVAGEADAIAPVFSAETGDRGLGLFHQPRGCV